MATKTKTEPKNNGTRQRVDSDHPLANCRPRGDRVVIRRDVVKKETEGGILLPDSVLRNKMPTGTVVRVGPGTRKPDGSYEALDLKEGDRVVLTNYAGLEIRDPNRFDASSQEEFIILRDEDVIAVL